MRENQTGVKSASGATGPSASGSSGASGTAEHNSLQDRKIIFSERTCKSLPTPDKGKEVEYTSKSAPRLRLAVSYTGRKCWVYRYTYNRLKKFLKIGDWPGIGCDEAKSIAREYGATLDRGSDPSVQRDIERSVPTLNDFVQDSYLPYVRKTKRSARDYESKLRLHLLPAFGNMRLSDITSRDIDLYRIDIAESHCDATANRHLSLVSNIFSTAIKWAVVDSNPCSRLHKLKESSSAWRTLDDNEFSRLYASLMREKSVTAASAILLLAFTGLRLREVLNARWEHLNIEDRTLFLHHTKTGKTRHVVLNELAMRVINGLKRVDSSPWLFAARDPLKPINTVRKCWLRVLADAEVPHTRIHDLRHGFASAAVRAGVPLYEVQQLLGHATSVTTQRYAHLSNTTLREASASAATRLMIDQ